MADREAGQAADPPGCHRGEHATDDTTPVVANDMRPLDPEPVEQTEHVTDHLKQAELAHVGGLVRGTEPA